MSKLLYDKNIIWAANTQYDKNWKLRPRKFYIECEKCKHIIKIKLLGIKDITKCTCGEHYGEHFEVHFYPEKCSNCNTEIEPFSSYDPMSQGINDMADYEYNKCK